MLVRKRKFRRKIKPFLIDNWTLFWKWSDKWVNKRTSISSKGIFEKRTVWLFWKSKIYKFSTRKRKWSLFNY